MNRQPLWPSHSLKATDPNSRGSTVSCNIPFWDDDPIGAKASVERKEATEAERPQLNHAATAVILTWIMTRTE